MNRVGESSTSADAAASLTIWNVCRSEMEPTRVFLRRKRTIFDSREGGPLRSFLIALNHYNSCVPFRVVLEQTEDDRHVLKALSQGSIGVGVGSGPTLTAEELISGVKLSHGDLVRVYYKLAHQDDVSGPFAFEYLTGDQPECQDQEPTEEPSGLPGQRIEKKPPLNLLELPDELLWKILSNVPSIDLFYNVSAVCQELNRVVQSGVPFKWFSVKHFTSVEMVALERMINAAPPRETAIEWITFDCSMIDSHEPSAQSQFFVRLLTREARVLELDIYGDALFGAGQTPKLQLKKLLPPECIKQLKYLEVKGNFHFPAQDDCCFEELKQLWLSWTDFDKSSYAIGALLGPHGENTFPKLTSVGLWGNNTDYVLEQIPGDWTDHIRAVPFERVQVHRYMLDFERFALITRGIKTVKMEFFPQCVDYCKEPKNMTHLENLAVFFPDVSRTLYPSPGAVRWADQSVTRTIKELELSFIKLLQLRLPTLSVEHLRIISEGIPNLEFLHVRFVGLKGQIDDVIVKEVLRNCSLLEGVGFEQEVDERRVLRNEWVEDRLRKTEDFWKVKIWNVFGPLDYVAVRDFPAGI